jgi:hypothetical protein
LGRTGGDIATIKQEANMALTENTTQDKIEIVGDYKKLQVRTANVISRDGVEISREFHRHVVAPDISAEDLANESTEVQAICEAVHTDAVKAAYAAMLEAQETP